ncbi:MAG: HU family DNA-binding protein [Ignavibacteria bacterium]
MTKAELVSRISKDAKISKVQAGAAIKSFVGSVTKSLSKGSKVSLVGFGTFSASMRKARIGRNPRTGESIEIKARKAARFKASKQLSRAIN